MKAEAKLKEAGIEMTDFISSSTHDAVVKIINDFIIKKDRLTNLLEDVVNELDLSQDMIEKHGQEGTAPATLVRLVLEEKDKKIAMLKSGMVQLELDPLAIKPKEVEYTEKFIQWKNKYFDYNRQVTEYKSKSSRSRYTLDELGIKFRKAYKESPIIAEQ